MLSFGSPTSGRARQTRAPSCHTAHGWRTPPCLTNVRMTLSRCPLTSSPSSLSVRRESTNIPAGPRTHSASGPLWRMVVKVDPRKIGKNGASFTIGCNVCTWEATFGEGEQGLFRDVEKAGKARRVHCGSSNESMAGVPRCPMLEQGYDLQPAPQLVRVCSLSSLLSLVCRLSPPPFFHPWQGLKKQPVYCKPADGVWSGSPVPNPVDGIVYRAPQLPAVAAQAPPSAPQPSLPLLHVPSPLQAVAVEHGPEVPFPLSHPPPQVEQLTEGMDQPAAHDVSRLRAEVVEVREKLTAALTAVTAVTARAEAAEAELEGLKQKRAAQESPETVMAALGDSPASSTLRTPACEEEKHEYVGREVTKLRNGDPLDGEVTYASRKGFRFTVEWHDGTEESLHVSALEPLLKQHPYKAPRVGPDFQAEVRVWYD